VLLQCLDDTARAALVFSQPAYKGLASEQLGTRVVRTGPRPCPSFLMHHHPPWATRRPNPAVPQYIKMVVNLFFSPAARVRVEPARRAAEALRCLCARTGGGRLFFSPFLSTWGVATVHAFYSLFNVSRLLEGAALVAGELVGII